MLFIDEIHRLKSGGAEVLYPAIGRISSSTSWWAWGPRPVPCESSLPPFTLVGATTRLGLLQPRCATVREIPLPLEFYTEASWA